MDFLIGEIIGALLSLVLVAPFAIIIYLVTYNKYDSNGDGLSG
jgi:hypothetical protein